jgi:hypothetical protein
MKAFFEKHKPAAIEILKNLGTGVGLMIVSALLVCIPAMLLGYSFEDVRWIAKLMDNVIYITGVAVIGKSSRNKIGAKSEQR